MSANLKSWIRLVLSLAAITLSAWSSCGRAAEQSADLIIRHATIVDVENGRTIAGQAIVTRGGEILAVGADRSTAASWRAKRTVDARGRYVIPGLWDMHMHFGGGTDLIDENKALLPLFVVHGITTIRDMAGDLPDQVLAWRDEIAAGRLFGPTLLTSGPKIEGIKPIWKGTIECGTKEDIDAALVKLQALRADFVKITDSTLDPQLFLYALSRTKALGMRSSGHIPMALTVNQATEAGLSSIEHLDYAFKGGVKDEAFIGTEFAAGRLTRAEANRRINAGFVKEHAMTMYRRYAAQGVSVTPTLNGSRIIAYLDRDSHADDAYLAYIGPKLRKTYNWRIERAAQADATAIAARHAHYENMASILPLLQDAGVTIMAGTDAGFLNSFNYPGVGLHDEMALFVEKGLTPAQVLATATRAGPAWLGKLNRFGAVAAGKTADLVLLRNNPLVNIAATREIEAVVMRGKIYDRKALDAMLSSTKSKVADWNRAGAK
ncbi:MAG: amidohydrolase family protein [Usitatibacteraceae bacterium]